MSRPNRRVHPSKMSYAALFQDIYATRAIVPERPKASFWYIEELGWFGETHNATLAGRPPVGDLSSPISNKFLGKRSYQTE